MDSKCYNEALTFALAWEGGYVHDPADAGGATMKGVTQATYNHFRKKKGLGVQAVKGITSKEIAEIYKVMYWDEAGCGLLPYPLCLTHFDTAVNFGVVGAAKKLQQALGVTVDGKIGPKTLALAQDPVRAQYHAAKYCEARIAHRHARVLDRPSQGKFLKGWLRRDNALLNLIRQIKG